MTFDICMPCAPVDKSFPKFAASFKSNFVAKATAILFVGALCNIDGVGSNKAHAQAACPTISLGPIVVTQTIGNNGNCTIQNGGNLVPAAGDALVAAGEGTTIAVNNGGMISNANNTSDAIAYTSLGGTLQSDLTIDGQVMTSGTGTGELNGANGVYSIHNGPLDVTVGTTGTITTTGANFANGILYRGRGGSLTPGGTIINNGAITTNGTSSSGIFIKSNGSQSQITNNGTITINGLGINNANTASHGILFTRVNGSAVAPGPSIAIQNNGNLFINELAGHGIFVQTNASAGSRTTIGNGANGVIRTTNQASKGIETRSFADVINNGLIDIQSIAGTGAYGIDVVQDSTILNGATGIIRTAGTQGYGMVARDRSTMTNLGEISTTGARGDGMRAQVSANNVQSNIFMLNAGTISTSGLDANGILGQNGNTITNNGSITTSGTDGDGIQLGANNFVTNNNTILATGPGSAGIRASVDSGGATNSYGNNTIINNGSIIGPSGILLFDSPGFGSRVETYGDVISSLGPNGVAIRFGETPNIANDDTLIIGLSDPNLIIGAMDMNNGDDTIILDRTNDSFAWRWTFDDFDPGAVIVTSQAACPATGDCLVIVPKAGQVYLQSGETDFQRNCGLGCQDATNEGMTIFLLDTNQVNYLSDASLDIITSAHAAIDSRIEQAWKIHLRKDRVIQPDEVVAFPDPDREMDFWFRPWIGMRHRMERDYLPETLHQWAGFLGGVNVRYKENWHFGALAGLARSYVDDMSTNQEGTLKHQLIGAQAHYDNDKYFVDYSILFGKSESDDMQPIKNNLVAGGIESDGDSPLLKGPFQSHSLRVGRRYQLHDDRWDLYLRPSAHAVYVRQTVEDIVYPGGASSSVSIGEFTTESIQARLELASELIKTNKRGVFHSDLRMGLAMRGVMNGGGATINTVTDQVTIGAEKEGDYTYSIYTGLGVAWETSAHWTLNLDGEADYSFGYGDFTGRIRGAANFRF